MAKEVKFGVLGLGCRGSMLMTQAMFDLYDKGLRVAAVCDLYEDRAKTAADQVEEKFGYRPFETTDPYAVINSDVDVIIIATAWEAHIELAIAAMEAGKFVGLEVGGAYNIEDCWKLVDTQERTKTPLMFLENCNFGKRETMLLNMVRQGLLGDIVHCDGGYCHDLRIEVANGKENRHYRLRNYLNRNCENYPTHEIGPIAKILDINNGNRFVSLVSMASSAKGLHQYILDKKGADHPLANAEFKQGDIVTTILKCANGQTVTISLDTTLPRCYSRKFTVRGTKGAYFEDNDMLYLQADQTTEDGRGLWGNAKQYEEKYLHEIWQGYTPIGGHDGMDYLTFDALLECVQTGKKPPLDVYDAATYMCITPLSEKSINLGSAPVEIPDFTRGKWFNRKDTGEDWKYNLDRTDREIL